jgi:predicted ATPase/DNA-binding CsgD family transcriptional regulator
MSAWQGDPAEPLVEHLTGREREILALLEQGYSAPEIAQRLTLAVTSVKSHIQHLYGKLGVNRRHQAITRARQLGLLGPSSPLASGAPLPDTPAGAPGTSPTPAAWAGQPPGWPAASLHNLPLPITQFLGREAEISQLKVQLAEHRLVTLTGSGGVGKSRLSLRVAEQVLGDFPDGLWFIALGPLTDPTLIPQHVAAILGLREEAGRPLLETLTLFLGQRRVLLILDNCEHLLGACARLADDWLRTCAELRILASSREPLGVTGEVVFRVPSLPFPDPAHLPKVEEVADYVAVRLFVDRARLVLPDYQVAAHNAAGLARICQRLDGIPLAIEMAAARVNILTADQLADRLDDAFRLLTGGSRAALPRQQTLRATVDWSYELLSAMERLLFQRLSVFAGGCTLEAAEAVCTDGFGTQPPDVLGILASLVAKSMVVAERRQGVDTRFRLLEFMHQYAHEKLREAGGSEQLAGRHRDYFLAFAEANAHKLHSDERLAWARKLEAEQENLHRALTWSFDDMTAPEAGPRLVMAMTGAWSSPQENYLWLKRAIACCEQRADISAGLHAAVLSAASRWGALSDPRTALGWAEQAVEISRGLGSGAKASLMDNLFYLGWIRLLGMVHLDEVDEALVPFVEAEALLQELGPEKFPAERYLSTMATLALVRANSAARQRLYQDVRPHARESIRLYEKARNPWGGYLAQICLGSADLNLGEPDQAREHFLEALRLADETGSVLRKANVQRWLAWADFRLGKLERALEYCQTSLRQAAKSADSQIVVSGLELAAAIWAKRGQVDRAARLSGAAQAIFAKVERMPQEAASLENLLPGWRTRLDIEVIGQAFEDGQRMTAEQALADALGIAAV